MATPPALTQGTLLDVDDGIGAAMRAYARAEAELRRELDRVVRIVALDPDSTARYRAAQIRGLILRLGQVQASLRGTTTVFAQDTLAQVYAEGMLRADRIARAGGAAALGSPSFTTIHRTAVEVLALDAFDDLAGAIDYLRPHTARIIREATKARTLIGAASGSTVGQDTRALVRELTERGVTGFVDAAGRNWRLSSYAEMVIRTKSATGYNIGTVLRTEETGTGVMEIRDGERSRHDECLRFSGQTCDPGWALANPVQHPNCVRSFGPLPLHRGAPQHTTGTSASQQVTAARDRRTNPDDLVITPPANL